MTALQAPGSRSVFPSASVMIFPVIGLPSRLTRPFSRISNATELALRTEVVFRFTLYAIRKSRAPMAVAPLRELNFAGP